MTKVGILRGWRVSLCVSVWGRGGGEVGDIRADIVLLRDGGGSVDVDFGEGDFSGGGVLAGEGFEDGRDDFARAAPGCVDCRGLEARRKEVGEGGVQSITTIVFLLARVESWEGVVRTTYFDMAAAVVVVMVVRRR